LVTESLLSGEVRQRRIELALTFLERSFRACPDGGSSAYHSRLRHPVSGWAPSYPETTGYIVPTLYRLPTEVGVVRTHEIADRAVDWLCAIQRPDGSFPGGVTGSPAYSEPSVFNTGQIIQGLVAAHHARGNEAALEAAKRAADWLSQVFSTETRSWLLYAYKDGFSPTYYTRVAWPMLQVSAVTGDDSIQETAISALDELALRVNSNHTFRDWGFTASTPAFTHTISYTLEGFLGAYRLLGDSHVRYRDLAQKTAYELLWRMELAGGIGGAYDENWRPAGWFQCLTGNCQLASVWLGLAIELDDLRYLNAAFKVLHPALKSQRSSWMAGSARGSIPGSRPRFGRYLTMRSPNWAAKFFVDALLDLEETLSSLGVKGRA